MVDRGRPSMRQLADRAGLAPETVRRLVFGYVDPDAETVNAVATALGRDVREVWAWVGDRRTVAEPYQPPAEADLLDERERKALDEVIRLLAASKRKAGEHGGDTAAIARPLRAIARGEEDDSSEPDET